MARSDSNGRVGRTAKGEHLMKDLQELIGSEEHDARMKAARERAEWELGDASWAGVIVGAYLYPELDEEALSRERD